jgi:O-6-methylguanine DNA methyltransferase
MRACRARHGPTLLEPTGPVLGKWIHGAPDLVIEILSPGTRGTDEVTKRQLFEHVGVREYWIVDGEVDVVKIYRRQEDGSFPRQTMPKARSPKPKAGPFKAAVLAVVRRIPPGRIATYGDVAAIAGRPRAARAVGNIMRECRDAAVPCHRVVGAGGALGGYGGNLELKRALLRAEGIVVFGRRIRSFARARWRRAPRAEYPRV